MVTQRYSIAGLLGKEEEMDVASVTSHEGEAGGGIMGEERTRGWRDWKVGWSWRMERADARVVVLGRGVEVARVWVDVKSGEEGLVCYAKMLMGDLQDIVVRGCPSHRLVIGVIRRV